MSSFTDSTVTIDGVTLTYVSGTDSTGAPLSYTALPPSDPSYVPSPSSSPTPSGHVSYSYIATPSGWVTETTDFVTTEHGGVLTYYSAPTAHGGTT